MHHETIIIIDFGSQVTQLIARRVREAGVYCEILPCTTPVTELLATQAKGFILSGGPASVHDADHPRIDPALFAKGVPVLGICYGLQATAEALGGAVLPSDEREFGRTAMTCDPADDLFHGLEAPQVVWMSHGDQVSAVPGAQVIGHSRTCPMAAVYLPTHNFHGVQFHPEVVHTENGNAILQNWLYRICGCAGDWRMSAFVDEQIERIRTVVGDDQVLLGLSGGVDSSVAAVLLHRAIGDRLTCVFVNNGVLRKNEATGVQELFAEHIGLRLVYVDASERFLSLLAGVEDPERKRKIIGHEFVSVFKEEAEKIKVASGGQVRFLAQGTLYPDVIESQSVHGGPASVIKSHHNVGGLPADLGLDLIEPFRMLFKDEVRVIGETLGLSQEVVWRHPFPGPGLAVRILGAVTADKVQVLQEADAIVRYELRAAGLHRAIWQAFAVLLPVCTVGVMGDERTYENVCAIRAISSTDGMTADWYPIPHEVLGRMSSRIINEVKGINRVVYDISSKPPATIEWE